MTYPAIVPHWIADVAVTPTYAPGGATAGKPTDALFFEKRNPATDEVIAQVARGGAAEVAHALSSAAGAAEAWGRTPVPKRGAILGRAAQLLREREALFGEIVQAETGKPWKNAVAEVASSADLAIFMEGEGSRLYGKTLPSPIPNRTVQTLRSPIGICAAIMPFNSPLAGVAWKVFPALLCGNAVVVKSHELTPYTAIAFGELLKDAGLPVGVYSAIQGYGPDAGAPLVQDHRVGVVSFTGSSATGKLIQKMVSGRDVLAKVCLELGGKNPFVVCDDADLDLATDLAVASAFIDAGQRCASGSRIIVFDAIYDAFRTAFLAKVAKVKLGSGADDDCGPVISRANLDRLIAQVGGAVKRGATLVAGGQQATGLGAGYYMQPTVLEHVSPDDEVSQNELFGPVTCLYRVSGFEEAVRLANGTHYGLTGAIHTSSLHRVQEFITRYQGGLVSINGATFGSGPHMPFGGVKNSGNGFREPGTEALDVYTELKTVVINHVPGKA
ncbi:MAG TPA: aldehyde dehydrogenase family protein [Vicinamibacterales bacterium]|nr:aldehyde dehydrogenase family protein [Vicinamibacterales bacterium]